MNQLREDHEAIATTPPPNVKKVMKQLQRHHINSRIALPAQKVLYKANGNLYTTAQAVKQYAKSVFGTQSDQYRKVSELPFTKPKT
mgnify:CR=1 FL=1